MKTAIRDNDPVLFMENTLLYGEKGEVPEEEYLIPLGKADVKREGTDITLIAHGRAVLTALKAAELLAAEHDINAEVIDLRTIRPLDEDAILASVRKTHRAVLRRGKQTLLRRRRADFIDAHGESLRRSRRPGPPRHLARRPGDLQSRKSRPSSSRARPTSSRRC